MLFRSVQHPPPAHPSLLCSAIIVVCKDRCLPLWLLQGSLDKCLFVGRGLLMLCSPTLPRDARETFLEDILKNTRNTLVRKRRPISAPKSRKKYAEARISRILLSTRSFVCSFIHSFIHSSDRYLLSGYQVPRQWGYSNEQKKTDKNVLPSRSLHSRIK